MVGIVSQVENGSQNIPGQTAQVKCMCGKNCQCIWMYTVDEQIKCCLCASPSGTPINKPPVLGYKDLNLFKLFRLVYHLGGCHKVRADCKVWHHRGSENMYFALMSEGFCYHHIWSHGVMQLEDGVWLPWRPMTLAEWLLFTVKRLMWSVCSHLLIGVNILWAHWKSYF